MFSKKILFSALILVLGLTVLSSEVMAQEQTEAATLSGQVIDASTQEALAGVQLMLQGADQEVTTSEDGSFTFEMVSAGTYMLTATAEGYKDWEKEIEITEGGDSITVELEPSDY